MENDEVLFGNWRLSFISPHFRTVISRTCFFLRSYIKWLILPSYFSRALTFIIVLMVIPLRWSLRSLRTFSSVRILLNALLESGVHFHKYQAHVPATHIELRREWIGHSSPRRLYMLCKALDTSLSSPFTWANMSTREQIWVNMNKCV